MVDANLDLFAKFEVGQGSADLFSELVVRQPGSANLYARFETQATQNLFAEFTVRQPGTQDLFTELIVRQPGSAELKAIFEVGQDSVNLFAAFIVQQTGTQDLFTEIVIRHSASVDLTMEFTLSPVFSGTPQNLFSKFFVGSDGTRDLYAKFTTQVTINLKAVFVVRHEAVGDIFVKFKVMVFFGEGWEDKKAVFLLRHSAYNELFSELIIRNIGDADLKGILIVRHMLLPRAL